MCRALELTADGRPALLNGEPLARTRPPACERCEKASFEDFSPENAETWRRYRIAKLGLPAAGAEDPMFQDDCLAIEEAVERIGRMKEEAQARAFYGG